MSFYNQPQVYTDFLDVMNLIFTVFFALEFVIKLAAYRPKVFQTPFFFAITVLVSDEGPFQEYFTDPWNSFDFVIVIGSFLDIAMSNLSVSFWNEHV